MKDLEQLVARLVDTGAVRLEVGRLLARPGRCTAEELAQLRGAAAEVRGALLEAAEKADSAADKPPEAQPPGPPPAPGPERARRRPPPEVWGVDLRRSPDGRLQATGHRSKAACAAASREFREQWVPRRDDDPVLDPLTGETI